MRCTTCDYPLWNLKTRTCPECGSPFLPSAFEFTQSSVQFCCPHCNQAYYGTDEKGHLVPREFDCVQCGAHISMDEMVLRPAEGLSDDQTRVLRNPWLHRTEIGRWKAWFKTIGMSIACPAKLATSDETGKVAYAWSFAAMTLFLYCLAGVVPLGLLMTVIGLVNGDDEMAMATPISILIGAGMAIAALLWILLWGLVAHGVLRLGGPVKPIGRTFEALCYTSGVMFMLAVPVLNGYCGVSLMWIWWMVAAIFVLAKAHGVSGARATLASLTFPILMVLLFIVGYAGLTWYMFSMVSGQMAMMPAPAITTRGEALTITSSLRGYSLMNNGQWPPHAAYLLQSDPSLASWDFLSYDTNTFGDDVTLPAQDAAGFPLVLDDFDTMQSGELAMTLRTIGQNLPQNIVAHRFGDFVFTYHGINSSTAPPNLWIVVMCDDPDAVDSFAGPAIDPVYAGMVDGSVVAIPRSSMAGAVEAQNVLRKSQGLPPLPDPLAVTHGQPATSGADDPGGG